MFSIYNSIIEKQRPLVMGILNVTPDSFFEAGKSFFAESAFNRALQIGSDGADIFALENGVTIVNDESGVFSKDMALLVKEYNANWIFMHTGNKTSSEVAVYENGVVENVLEFFKSMKEQALNFGIDENKLCFDYGIGFGKTREDDLTLIKNTGVFNEFKPLLVGVSNKRVVGQATGREVDERLFGTVSAESVSVFLGADVIRTHNVKACVDSINMITAIKKGGFVNG